MTIALAIGRLFLGLENASSFAPTVTSFVVLSSTMLAIGAFGVLARRNRLAVTMSIVLMRTAAALNFVAFSRYWSLQGGAPDRRGQVFALFVVVAAVAHVAVGLALAIGKAAGRPRDDAAEREEG